MNSKEAKLVMNMNRRTFVKLAGTAAAALALGSGLTRLVSPAVAVPAVSSPSLTKYMDALPIPPKIDATSVTIAMAQGTQQFHSQLLPAPAWGYGGAGYLGPTIEAMQNVPIQVTWLNNLPQMGNHLLQAALDPTIPKANTINGTNTPIVANTNIPAVVHLHGGHNYADNDGTPMQWYTDGANPVQGSDYKTNIFTYPNDQPSSTVWYHDHAYGFTRHNVYAGLAAFYLIRDAYEMDLINGTNISGKNAQYLGNWQKIPSGYGTYEIPIALQDKIFNPDGSMFYPTVGVTAFHPIWVPEFFGDTPVVNGKAYPFLSVEPRRYRLRFVNGSQARFYNIWFDNGAPVPFWIIGSDGGLLPTSPAMVSKLLISPGERYDIIFDFTGMAGTSLILKNNAKAPYPGGQGGLGQIMQFRVNKPLNGIDTTTPPASLVLPPLNPASLLPPAPGTVQREIVLKENLDPVTGKPIEVLLNGAHYDTTNPPMFTPAFNSTEAWQFINLTVDAHPMHLHLVQFQIMNRQPFDVAGFMAAWNIYNPSPDTFVGTRPTINNFLTKGAAYLSAPEEKGWKDTAKAYPGEVLRVVAKFDKLGKYVCHCHILEHEENDMMFEYKVA